MITYNMHMFNLDLKLCLVTDFGQNPLDVISGLTEFSDIIFKPFERKKKIINLPVKQGFMSEYMDTMMNW